MFKEPFDKDLLAKMEAGNRKLYAKDMSSIALTTQHKRGIIGAFVEGRIKLPTAQKNQNTSSNQNQASQSNKANKGSGQASTRGAKTERGRGGSGRGNRGRGGSGRGGGTTRKAAAADDSEPKPKQSRGGQGQQRGEKLPPRGDKKLVDRLRDPHIQAIIRDQIDKGVTLVLLTRISFFGIFFSLIHSIQKFIF